MAPRMSLARWPAVRTALATRGAHGSSHWSEGPHCPPARHRTRALRRRALQLRANPAVSPSSQAREQPMQSGGARSGEGHARDRTGRPAAAARCLRCAAGLARLARRVVGPVRARRGVPAPDQSLRLVRARAAGGGDPVARERLAVRHLPRLAHALDRGRAPAGGARRRARAAGAVRHQLLLPRAPVRARGGAAVGGLQPGAPVREPGGVPVLRAAPAPARSPRRDGAGGGHRRAGDPAAPEAPGPSGDRLPRGRLSRRRRPAAGQGCGRRAGARPRRRPAPDRGGAGRARGVRRAAVARARAAAVAGARLRGPRHHVPDRDESLRGADRRHPGRPGGRPAAGAARPRARAPAVRAGQARARRGGGGGRAGGGGAADGVGGAAPAPLGSGALLRAGARRARRARASGW